MTQKEEHEISDEAKERAKNYMALKGALEVKEKTIEEVAERLYQKGLKDDLSLSFHDGVKFGAKWQEERMYSDMEEYSAFVLKSYKEGLPLLLAKEWFEQFKKKGGDK